MRIINNSVVFLTFNCLMMINILIMLQITSSYKEKTAALFLLAAFWTHVLNLLRNRVLLFFCTWELWYHFCRFFDLWPLMIRNIPIIQCIIHNIIWIWIWCGIEKTVSLAHLSAFWEFFEFAAKRFLFCFSINDNYYFMSVCCDFFVNKWNLFIYA